ncbi:MAG: hypothetical protein IPM51_12825 [Sphingobacteriaceae bacterium]|nr:hypothetical protein [Sphingobacteriaceae bacterium]
MSKIIFFIFCSSALFSQLPETDLILFKLKNVKNELIITESKTLTNRPGYDNQPSFTADQKNVFYVAIGEDKQADIYSCDFKSGKTMQVTKTAESEYSPTWHADKNVIHAVVVEKDSSQRIHAYDVLSRSEKGLLFDEDSIGYFTYLNSDTVLYYKLTQPHSLRMRACSSGQDQFIASSIIRGFKKINRHSFIFGIKDSTKVDFYTYDFNLAKAFYYCTYPSLAEDIIWHPQWGLLKSEKNQILRFSEETKQWTTFLDLEKFGIKTITRFIFDKKNKYLIVVNNK